jgi:hypothetical protein
MSHKITINTEFTDKVALEHALQTNNWKYEIRGQRVDIQEGPGAHGWIDLKTGKFRGDTDFHSIARLAPLTQAYGEASWTQRFATENGYLESRTVLQDGTIRLVGTVMVA